MLDSVFERSYQIVMPVTPGKPKTVVSGYDIREPCYRENAETCEGHDCWVESCEIEFEVRVTATIEEGRLAVPPGLPAIAVPGGLRTSRPDWASARCASRAATSSCSRWATAAWDTSAAGDRPTQTCAARSIGMQAQPFAESLVAGMVGELISAW